MKVLNIVLIFLGINNLIYAQNTFPETGNAGIGTENPLTKLHIINEPQDSDGGNSLIIGPIKNSNLRLGYNTGYSWIQSHGRKPLYINEAGNNTLINSGFGYVGIGTLNPAAKLTVAGGIHSREIKVSVEAGADYVFSNNYSLPSLEEVALYIVKNKHLPEIPSAGEMQAKGLSLGEMSIMLLKKIEELTLYVIEQNKEISELKETAKKA